MVGFGLEPNQRRDGIVGMIHNSINRGLFGGDVFHGWES